MKAIVDAARSGDFVEAKRIFDESISANMDPKSILNQKDGHGKTVAHYAVLYDDVVVVEWLYNMGSDLFVRDNSNKSAIETAVLVDAKMKRKMNKSSEVLEFIKRVVLNPIQRMFFIEACESTDSVTDTSALTSMTLDALSEKFPYHNDMQAIHLFAIHDRLDELEYMKSRGVDMSATDEDGNNILHFSSSLQVIEFAIRECRIDVNARNTSDGNTAAHMIVERVASDELDEDVAMDMLEALLANGADFTVKCDEPSMNVAELAVEYLGRCPITLYCAEKVSSATGRPIDDILNADSDDDYSDISVASHKNRALNEDGEDTEESDSEDESGEDEEDDEDDESDESAQSQSDESEESESDDDEPMFAFRK